MEDGEIAAGLDDSAILPARHPWLLPSCADQSLAAFPGNRACRRSLGVCIAEMGSPIREMSEPKLFATTTGTERTLPIF